jgi:hypothetical protein
MHLSDDKTTILFPYPTIYQCQVMAWQRAERCLFWRGVFLAFLFGVVLSYPIFGG